MVGTAVTAGKGTDRGEYHRGRRHIDHYRVLGETVSTLEGLAMGLRLVDIDAIPQEERSDWASQLGTALRPVRRFTQELAAISRGVSTECAHCGAAFVPLRSDARFCSGRCRVARHRAAAWS